MSRNRRFWDRTKFDGTVQLTYTDIMEGSLTISCRVENFSDEGLGISSHRALRAFIPLQLLVGADTYEGEVRYCRKNSTGDYDLGTKVFFDQTES